MAKVGDTYKTNQTSTPQINAILESRPHLGGTSGAINWAINVAFEVVRKEAQESNKEEQPTDLSVGSNP